MSAKLHKKYKEEIIPKLLKQLGYTNALQAPKLNKIVINMGVGSASQDPKFLDWAIADLAAISGQKPVATQARKAEAGFKIREGMKVGCKVTLRGDKMYNFLDKLVNVAMPRIKDFRGVPTKSFDGQGNYALGLKEQIIFPEIHPDSVDRIQGMDIIFEITSKGREESKALLEHLGVPFRKQ